MEALDCGALAAVAIELYRLRGLEAAPVQLALRYPAHATGQWSAMWHRAGSSNSWISGQYCYHEACGVIHEACIDLWDPTETRWLEPPLSLNETFSAVTALRVAADAFHTSSELNWCGLSLKPGQWHSVHFDKEGRLTLASI
jgi:hypothetical protein